MLTSIGQQSSSYVGLMFDGAAAAIADFEAKAADVRGAYLAPNSNRAYLTGKKAFVHFMQEYRYAPILPASDFHLSLFVVYEVHVRKNLVSTAKQYLFGIRALHLEHGYPWTPWADRFPIYQALRGCKRIFSESEDRAPPKLEITFQILKDLSDVILGSANLLKLTRKNQLTLWAVCLVAFFGLLRKDNVTVAKASSFNPNRCLLRSDFTIAANVMLVKLRWSKVIQFSDRFHSIPYCRTGTALCPVSAVENCFRMTDSTEEGPAFSWEIRRNKCSPLTHATFISNVKRAVHFTGRDPQRYSGISFRRGGASTAADLGGNHELIKELGDWKSDAYLRYVRRPTIDRLSLPTLLANAASRY